MEQKLLWWLSRLGLFSFPELAEIDIFTYIHICYPNHAAVSMNDCRLSLPGTDVASMGQWGCYQHLESLELLKSIYSL